MARTRIKICGITQPAEAILIAKAGVDAIGLVFYPPSPRHIEIEQAEAVIAALPPFVTTVALFMDASREAVQQVLECLPIDLLQFHGVESEPFCASFGRPYIKSVPMGESQDVASYAARYPMAQALLLDSNALGVAGGGGECFDWQRMPRDLAMPLILAGGLKPENVAEAIAITAAYGVDVSSGVEREKGVKDPALMLRFIDEVNRVDHKNR